MRFSKVNWSRQQAEAGLITAPLLPCRFSRGGGGGAWGASRGEAEELARARGLAAFTMVEIALSLAVIGFALVAIIGILPLGMNVQRENREETIINQDATVLMEAIRNGNQGFDDLTNYVIAITNVWATYDNRRVLDRTGLDWYTPTDSRIPGRALTNGFRIVGLLSTPRYVHNPSSGGFLSNYVVANFRSMSGAAYEKFPQDDPTLREMAFSYRLISEIITFGTPASETVTNNAWDPGQVNYGFYATNTSEYASRAAYLSYVTNLQNNLHDVRLIFRWPLRPDGRVGNGRQVYCTTVGGRLRLTNDLWSVNYPLFFMQPTTYTTNSL